MEVIITTNDRVPKTLRIIDKGDGTVQINTSQVILIVDKKELKKAIDALQ